MAFTAESRSSARPIQALSCQINVESQGLSTIARSRRDRRRSRAGSVGAISPLEALEEAVWVVPNDVALLELAAMT